MILTIIMTISIFLNNNDKRKKGNLGLQSLLLSSS